MWQLYKRISIFVIPILLFLVLVILIDPMGLIPRVQLLPVIGFAARPVKTMNYLESNLDYDMLILGSSRTMRMDSQITDSLGYKTYNFAMFNTRMEDQYCILKLVLDKNRTKLKKVILGIDPEMFHNNRDVDWRLYSVPVLSDYLYEWQRRPISDFTGKIVQINVRNTIWSVLFYIQGKSKAKEKGFIAENGNIFDTPLQPQNVAVEKMDHNKSEYLKMMSNFTDLDSTRLKYLDDFLDLCYENEIDVALYLTPVHPEMYLHLDKNSEYGRMHQKLAEYLSGKDYPNLLYRDYSVPELFEGRNEDFTDLSHMASVNCYLVMQKLLHVEFGLGLE
ncbi:MAG: hypothetical protein P9L92_17615 [Candidatus Electryonea clarkiae]|nr:hypothetical protein [Candidatus Electryonea clarkiae]MDP8285520.1 hypothetical protein [Candidatus Electryonea clarkiae]